MKPLKEPTMLLPSRLYRQLLASLVAVMLLGACKSSRQIQSVMQARDTTQVAIADSPLVDSAAIRSEITSRIEGTRIAPQWFASKIKVDYTDIYKKNTNATAFIKIKKDEMIWVSLTGALGIEGFRAILTPDSVVVMDKLDKSVSRRSISGISDFINLPVDFNAVQDLILGNVLFFDQGVSNFRFDDANNLLALSVGNFFKHLVQMDTTSNTIVSSKLDDVDDTRNRTAFIKMSNYVLQDGYSFSTVRELSVAEKNKLDIKLEFKQMEFDRPQSFPFNIPKSYREK